MASVKKSALLVEYKTSSVVKEFDPRDIRVPQNLCREQEPPIEGFAAQLLRDGQQLQPGVVEIIDGYPSLIAGHQRLRAIRDVINPQLEVEGKKPWAYRALVECLTKDTDLLSISENLRAELTPLDLGKIITHLLEVKKWNQGQAGEFLRRSQSSISQHYKIYKYLIPEFKEKLGRGDLIFMEAYRLAGLADNEQLLILHPPTLPPESTPISPKDLEDLSSVTPSNMSPKEVTTSSRESESNTATEGGPRKGVKGVQTFFKIAKKRLIFIAKQEPKNEQQIKSVELFLNSINHFFEGTMTEEEMWGEVLTFCGDRILDKYERKVFKD